VSPVILLLLLLAALMITGYGLLMLRRAEDDPLSARIEAYAAREEAVSIEEIELSLPLSDRLLVPIVRRLSQLVVRLAPQSVLERTERQLELAGNPRGLSTAAYWLLRLLSTLLMGWLGYLAGTRSILATDQPWLYLLIGAGLGYLLPAMYLRALTDRRREAIIKKLPDALDLMTICVNAGLTFNAAMQRVAEKWNDALAREFERVLVEMQLGKSRRQALRDMSERMNVTDVTTFVAAIVQAEQLGVGIAGVLRIQSEQMRTRRRQRAEEKAQRAPVQLVFPLVLLIFPSVLLVLLGPALRQLYLVFAG
jgi:tight adherence protein C